MLSTIKIHFKNTHTKKTTVFRFLRPTEWAIKTYPRAAMVYAERSKRITKVMVESKSISEQMEPGGKDEEWQMQMVPSKIQNNPGQHGSGIWVSSAHSPKGRRFNSWSRVLGLQVGGNQLMWFSHIIVSLSPLPPSLPLSLKTMGTISPGEDYQQKYFRTPSLWHGACSAPSA